MWLILSGLTFIFWGVSQFFYKLGNSVYEKYSSSKTVIMVGLIFGAYIIIYYFLISGFTISFSIEEQSSDNNYNLFKLISYLPISLSYIVSMWFSYIGLRYLELGIASPIQNASGGFSAILIIIFSKTSVNLSVYLSIFLITLGTILLAFNKSKIDQNGRAMVKAENSQYRFGALAVIFPIIYMILDSIGTFLDGIVLDQKKLFVFGKELIYNFNEDEAQISYMLTFFILSLLLIFYFFVVKKIKLFTGFTRSRLFGAFFELLGQITYIFALASNSIFSAPIIAAFSIVPIILGRVFLKERLMFYAYFAATLIIVGTIILGLNDI